MNGIYVYGITRAGATAPAGTRLLPERGVAAIVGDVGPGDVSPPDQLRAHWRILEEAAQHDTVLPLRFGTVLDDADAARSFLAAAHDDLRDALQELEGKVQLTVKGDYVEEALMRAVVERSPAVRELRERVRGIPEDAAYYERIRLGELVAAEAELVRAGDEAAMLAELTPLAVATRPEEVKRPGEALNAAFLVRRDDVARFGEVVARLAKAYEGRIQLRFVGPLPPYSFTPPLDARERAAWA